jgi:hypothetical protein
MCPDESVWCFEHLEVTDYDEIEHSRRIHESNITHVINMISKTMQLLDL